MSVLLALVVGFWVCVLAKGWPKFVENHVHYHQYEVAVDDPYYDEEEEMRF